MEEGLIHSFKISSVGPANVTGPDAVLEPGNMDLAMKLHYLRGLYYFRSPAFAGFTLWSVKEPLFSWLDQFPVSCGRLRRTDSGRPYIKCNDCGARLVQAKCDRTLDEWLETVNKHDDGSDIDALESHLCTNHTVGPDLEFSPLVYFQLTEFKCGGMAVGLSWAHILGDAFSAAKFMNNLGRSVSGFKSDPSINPAQSLSKPLYVNGLPKAGPDPISIKRVGPVGDNWVHATPRKMESFSFHVTHAKLSHLRSKCGGDFAPFEALAAVIWQCVARIRDNPSEVEVVNIFKKSGEETRDGVLGHTQVVSAVKAGFAVAEANSSDVARLVRNAADDGRGMIEEAMERDGGLSDFIVYGANLSLVNLEEASFYDFECKGEKPIRVVYRADGVGERGTVLVMQDGSGGGEEGRLVTVVLPENDVVGIKSELRSEGVI